ncbi:cobalamin-dependent protein [Saccharomonospora sp.]|uniref:cobalamin B12-binding domain-containing protein n=1 Tax=Saccharomonospora sp. TaxID=33913 RepID=UPI002618FDE6|nr:cobalamin-dependent protein [Saccharomonospora sp.]
MLHASAAVPGASGDSNDSAEVLDAFERELIAGNTTAAVTVVQRALDAGLQPLPVLCEVITPAQHRVGEKWHTGRWSMVQEHVATGISLAATEAVARRVRQLPVTKGHIMVCCAERERHALAALVVSTGLRAHGWRVTFLGAAIPAERLFSYLYRTGPDAVAISCSVAGGLPSTRRGIESATAVGVPVLAGGAAFGSDELRARALGATAWASTLREGLDLADRLPTTVHPVESLPYDVVSEQRILDAEHHRLVHQVLERWNPVGTGARDLDEIMTGDIVTDADLDLVVRGCAEQPLRALEGALLTGDGRLLREVADWIRVALESRAVPSTAVGALRGELLSAVDDLPRARALLEQHWPDTPLEGA